jgi:hypothetical protein
MKGAEKMVSLGLLRGRFGLYEICIDGLLSIALALLQ